MGIGDSVVDQYPQRGKQYPGGNSANFCVYASMAGHQASYLGVLGGDVHADHIRRSLSGFDVDLTHTRNTELPTNLCRVTLTNGNREIEDSTDYDLFSSCPILLDDADFKYIARHDLVHTSLYAHIDDQLVAVRETGAMVAYDYSNFWSTELVRSTCQAVDIGFFSFPSSRSWEEGKQRMLDLHSLGCGLVVATAGKRGACVYNGRRFYEKMPYHLEVPPVDTLGAGDAFLTGFSIRYTQGMKLRKNMEANLHMEWQRDDWEDYEDRLIENSMAAGNLIASYVCGIEAAFGCGMELK